MILVINDEATLPVELEDKKAVSVSTVYEAVRMLSTHGHFDEIWFGLNVSGFGGVVKIFEHLEGLNRDFTAPLINRVVLLGHSDTEVDFMSAWMRKLNIKNFKVITV